MDVANGEVLFRKVVCAVLPPGVRVSRRLGDGTVMGGPNRPGHGGRGVFIFGESLEPELALLDVILPRGGVLIDVGANSGLYSLRGARIVGDAGTVLSLEPNPQMLAVLDQNVRANGYGNVRLRGLAASDARSSLSFYENKNMPNSFSLHARAAGVASFSVLAVDLDSLLDWEGIDRVDVIKIDAEGVEDLVLRGASSTVGRDRPVIIAEVTRDGLSRLPPGYESLSPAGHSTNNAVLVPMNYALRSNLKDRGWVATREVRPETRAQ